MSNPRTDYLLEYIANEHRGFLINDTADHTDLTNVTAVVVLEDTVFSNLEVNSTDILADMNLTGETLTQYFPPIGAGKDKLFNRVKLTSGAVWAVTTNDDGE